MKVIDGGDDTFIKSHNLLVFESVFNLGGHLPRITGENVIIDNIPLRITLIP